MRFFLISFSSELSDLFLGEDLSFDLFLGEDLSFDLFLGEDLSFDLFLGEDLSFDLFLGEDLSFDLFLGEDLSFDLFFETVFSSSLSFLFNGNCPLFAIIALITLILSALLGAKFPSIPCLIQLILSSRAISISCGFVKLFSFLYSFDFGDAFDIPVVVPGLFNFISSTHLFSLVLNSFISRWQDSANSSTIFLSVCFLHCVILVNSGLHANNSSGEAGFLVDPVVCALRIIFLNLLLSSLVSESDLYPEI